MFAMGPAFFRQATGGVATLALSGSFAAATVGVAYSSSLAIIGGLAPYSLTSGTGVASGSLPAGLALSISGANLILSGTPTTAATSNFTVAVDSGDGQTATSAQSVTTAAAVVVTWNPADKEPNITLSSGNLKGTDSYSGNAWLPARATLSYEAATANRYFEATFTGTYLMVGVMLETETLLFNQWIGQTPKSYSYYSNNGAKANNGIQTTPYGATWVAGDVAGILLKNGKVYFRKNGVWQNSADPIAETGFAFSGLTGKYKPAASIFLPGDSFTGRFNAASISGSLPVGTLPWEG